MKKVLCLIVLMLVCSVAQAATVAYWQFDDDEPGAVTVAGQRIVDGSGNGRDLYTVSTPAFIAGNPLYDAGSAMYLTSGADELWFDAGYDFGDGGDVAGSSLDFAANDSFTIEAMIRIPGGTTASTICCILQKYGTNGTDPIKYPSIYLRTESSTKIRFSITDDVNTTMTYTVENLPNLYDGKWHHIAALRDYLNSEMRVYLDYTLVGSTPEAMFSGSWTDTASRWYVGSMGPATQTTREFRGAIDFIRVSNAVLSTSEFIQADYADRFATSPTPADRAYDVAIPSVALSWTPAAAATVSSQVVQVATDEGFTNIIQTFNLGGSATTATLTPVVNNRRYYWRVNTTGVDSGVSFSQTGLPWYFQTPDADSTLIGYWKFDNVAAGTVIDPNAKIIDTSSNGRNLRAVSVSSTASAKYDSPCAAYGSGASFNNNKGMQLNLIPGYMYTDGTYAAATPVLPSSNGNMTIEAVVKVNAGTATGSSIFTVQPTADSVLWDGADKTDGFYLRVNDSTGYLRFTFGNETTSCTATGITSVYDAWHHIAAVRDTTAGTLNLYIDGVLDKTVTDTTVALGDVFPSGYLSVGGFACYASTSRNLSGNIDFVKVTRSALAPAQFVQSFALPTNPNPVNGATGVPLAYTFSWSAITGATITSQTVKIADDQYMQNIVKTVTASGNSAGITGLENNKTYYWRVDTVGSDTNGAFSRQGEIWSFSTPNCLLVAADGDLNGDCIVDFKDFAIMAGNWLTSEFEE
jgi:hypothetical protein